MARPQRVYIEKVLYYVTSRGGHGQEIFIHPSDYKAYVDLIAKYKQQFGFKLFAYVLLPTHLHMLIEVRNNITISNILHSINSRYTKIFNSQHGKKGHLFHERFKAVLAEKEFYLLPLIRHIHLNPVRDRLPLDKRVKLVDDLLDYPYSSYSQFLDPAKREHPQMKEEIEEIFTVLKGRENAFAKFISSIDQRGVDEFKNRIHKKRILGSAGFVDNVEKIMEESIKTQRGKRPLPKRTRMIYAVSAAVIIFLVITTISFFYKQSTTLKTKYDKTLALYQTTLEMLKREQGEALKAKKDIKGYQWKIRLTEEALKKLQAERKKALKAEKGIDGYAWVIKLTQIGGPKIASNNMDVISFYDNCINSKNTSRKGFLNSRYSKKESRGGKVVWMTIQTNPQQDGTVSWRGEWDGKKMRGVLSQRSAKGVVRNFSFVSVGERIKRGKKD